MSQSRTPPGHGFHDTDLTDEPLHIDELRAVSNLLRRLPDPEPPEALRPRILAQVRAEAAAGARRPRHPGLAAALAAGVAGLFLLSASDVQLGDIQPSTRVTARSGAAARPQSARVPFATSLPAPETRALAGDPLLAAVEVGTPSSLPPLDRRLDRQLDQMLHQPDAFFRRLERIRDRERYLARLAERSARRGDSAAIALRVRSTRHPLASTISERFFHASLAEGVRGRRTLEHAMPQPRAEATAGFSH